VTGAPGLTKTSAVAVVLNASAGPAGGSDGRDTLSRVREAFERSGLPAEIVAVGPEGLLAAAQRAVDSEAKVVVIGGGDGTLSSGASALVGGSKPLGILPLGTLNHFAKDVGIPLDLGAAVEVIRDGHVSVVDVGEVNGRVFLNNSSIGLYPSAVDQREELRRGHRGGKWSAMVHASADVFRRFPLLDARLQIEGRTVAVTTPFIFVGNNRYEMNLFSLGTRANLDGGELSLYLTRNTGRMGLLRLAFLALLGRLEQARDFRSFTLPEVEIRTGRRSLRVSLDGEVVKMSSPIRYRLRPRALRVLTPPPDEAQVGS
jgi:diacylglycerol kinase family enzyme